MKQLFNLQNMMANMTTKAKVYPPEILLFDNECSFYIGFTPKDKTQGTPILLSNDVIQSNVQDEYCYFLAQFLKGIVQELYNDEESVVRTIRRFIRDINRENVNITTSDGNKVQAFGNDPYFEKLGEILKSSEITKQKYQNYLKIQIEVDIVNYD